MNCDYLISPYVKSNKMPALPAIHSQPRSTLLARSAQLALVGQGQRLPTYNVSIYASVISHFFPKRRNHGFKCRMPFCVIYILWKFQIILIDSTVMFQGPWEKRFAGPYCYSRCFQNGGNTVLLVEYPSMRYLFSACGLPSCSW